ncbi:4-hydroxy-tetrahydrodipicolinate synthase [Halanaerobium saccharolyticum]|uniref:4-hydroxy-tetrahydrodipicolinate synthase n=1 Tax=Halanaerobium saccharolyticum TaxID=43595 RepID=A0A4R7Z5R7_9FIRM|nr:4-hydroxy-tetrahydrodipicolinate synthase [Halanaerobium saccharolyticum]RAK12582.1 4-hydroxy-tetrahydrodipicolinate synthase [Halanaerobium saccharolyticum]TDW06508.1 4-hydroxy-tetrahydrodipicolinate synthase [Halanaerobium saccharolyticum]TDX61756.1 4-hydroxy-tetrahydrodipicolinate synthase [Halanaerobium saccharolyticum]
MLNGVITPMVTLFNENNKIDYEANKYLVNYLIDSKVDGILIFGSIGEFFSISLKEKKKYLSYIIDLVDNRVPILVGTGGNIIEEVIDLSQFSASQKADAIVLLMPYFFDLDQKSIYNYYTSVAENIDLPIYIYNFPARTGVNLEIDTIAKLIKSNKKFVGLKDSVTTLDHTRKLINKIKALEPEFDIFSGFDEHLIPNLLVGGNGIIGGLSNIVPKLFVSTLAAYKNQEWDKLEIYNKKISILMEIYDVTNPFIKAIKEAVAINNNDILASCKFPMSDCTRSEKNEIEKTIARAEISDFI